MSYEGIASSPRAMIYESAVAGPPITMSVWFNTPWPGTYPLVSLGDSGSYYKYHYLTGYTGGYLEAGVYHGRARTSTTYAANTWNHGCGIIASSTDRRVFLNGGGKGVQTSSVFTYSSMDRVGIGCKACNNVTYMGYYYGLIADFAVWDVALSDEEVTALAAGISPWLIRPESLKIFRPLRASYMNELDSAIDVASYTNGTVGFNEAHAPIWTPQSQFIMPGEAVSAPSGFESWTFGAC